MTIYSESTVTDDGWEETFHCCQYESWDVARVYADALMEGGFSGEVEVYEAGDLGTTVHVKKPEKRKVLISPGFGSGFAYGQEKGKQLAEDSTLIELVENGNHLSDRNISNAFLDRIREIDPENAEYISLRGIESLKVVEVEGPYQIREYDGSEWVVERDKVEWW